MNEFEVTFNATNIDITTVSNTAFMMLSMRYYTSCGGQAYTTGESYAMQTANSNQNPCTRNDKVWINPPSSGIWGSIAGTNAVGICNFPGSWVNPETHSVAIFDITGGGNVQISGSPFLVEN